MPAYVRWVLGLGLAGLLVVVPFVHFRAVYAHGKRLREVTPGKVYRSGQMTADGFGEAVARYHIRTVINLQDDYPDPDVQTSFWSAARSRRANCAGSSACVTSSCRPTWSRARQVPAQRPEAIDRFLDVMDDPASYPVLIHCKAGLHRTGVMVAVYRMEYQGWSPPQAIRELKDNGFGEWPCTAANDYVTQYVLTYRPGLRAVGGRRRVSRGRRQRCRVRPALDYSPTSEGTDACSSSSTGC